MTILKTTIFVLIITTQVISQNDGLSYYPMHIGDKWQYSKLLFDYFEQDTISYDVITEYIIGDTTIDDGFSYFKYEITTKFGVFDEYRRIDTLTSTLIYHKNCELLILSPNIDSVWYDSCGMPNYTRVDTSSVNDFEIIRPKIIYEQPFNIFNRTLANGLGLTYREEGDLGLHLIQSLIYAEVAGIVYDVPTILNVKSIQTPSFPNLSQNYPNPFNSETMIEVYLPESEYLSLSVYNIAGELVERIYEGTLHHGSHNFKWNAKSYSSGIYLYKLGTKRNSIVKKMFLVR